MSERLTTEMLTATAFPASERYSTSTESPGFSSETVISRPSRTTFVWSFNAKRSAPGALALSVGVSSVSVTAFAPRQLLPVPLRYRVITTSRYSPGTTSAPRSLRFHSSARAVNAPASASCPLSSRAAKARCMGP